MGAAVVAVAMAGAACDTSSSGPGATGSPLTVGQLEERIAAGATRVELKLRSGRASELHVHGPDGEERLQGWVGALDAAAGTVTISDLGVVSFGSGTRFRTLEESRATRDAWVTELEAELAGGPVFVRASRLASGVPQAPDDATFIATDLRIEDEGDPKLELDIDVDNLASGSATLRVLGRSFDIGTIRMTDDSGHDLGDDHGDDGIEAGDDHGDDGPEAGDDNGNDGPEAGDDNGNDGPEAGDDHGNDGPEAGDDNGNDGPEAGDDHGNDGPEASDDKGGDDR